jgi:hypothetical protein
MDTQWQDEGNLSFYVGKEVPFDPKEWSPDIKVVRASSSMQWRQGDWMQTRDDGEGWINYSRGTPVTLPQVPILRQGTFTASAVRSCSSCFSC